ncbi:MAG TPA: N-acetylmuramoyl-L-alanine amidase [Candidatus Eisenbacteria bacterium]|nr:N-acetylmuramoyl-L-alanine amidase [Candidatus Eisenbacteria bacterium]
MRPWLVALAVLLAAAFGAAAPAPPPPAPLVVERTGQGKAELVPVRTLDGQDYLAARDLARLVGASLHWRSDVRKLVVRTVHHDLKFVVDSRWVVLDEGETFQLDAPARQVQGEVWVPVSVFETILSGRFVPQARLARGHLLLVADEPDAGPPQLTVEGAITRLELPSQRPLDAGLVSARVSRFTVHVPGAHLTPLPGDTLVGQGLVSRALFRRETGGLWIELALASAAEGYRLRTLSDPERIQLEIARAPIPTGFVPLVAELAPGVPRPLRVLVIDPGHGGSDSGYVALPGVREKDLTLALARALRDELRRRLPGTEIQLTREKDEDLAPPLRVEQANRAHADLYLSLHFDAAPGTNLAGVTAYVAPPLGIDPQQLVGGEDVGVRGRPRPRPVLLVSWPRAAGRHHGEARTVADLLVASLAADGRGPGRVRVLPTYPTEGADCPAVLLECGTAGRKEEIARLVSPDGIHALAVSLARAVERYALGEAWP